MASSVASHIPVLSVPTFKSLAGYDPVFAEVLDPGMEELVEISEEDRLRAEYERGLGDGQERTRAHYETLLEQEREMHAKQLEEERVRFDMREAANVSAAIDGFMNVMEQRISFSLSRMLHPFLAEKITAQLVSAFADNLRQLAQDGDEKMIRLSGPENLVQQVLEQLPSLRDRIEVQRADQVELVALLDETTIETRLGQWLNQLNDMQKETD